MPTSELAPFYNNPKYSDIAFVVGETQTKFYASKALLAVSSSVFDAMLFGEMQESHQGEIEDLDVDAEAFETILKFIYTGELAINEENVISVVYAAKKYAIDQIETRCEEFFTNELTEDNVLTILQQADLFSLARLKERCAKFVCTHANEIFEGTSFLDLSKRQFTQLIARDDLRVKEVNVFRAVYNWVQNKFKDKSDQIEQVKEFLPHIRFSAMTGKDLINHVFTTEIFDLQTRIKLLSERVVNNDVPQNVRRCFEDLFEITRGVAIPPMLKEGWKVVYQHPYNHVTRLDELLDLAEKAKDDTLVCVGAIAKSKPDEFIVCAQGVAKHVLRVNGDTGVAKQYGGVYWYLVEGKSFGFGEASNINLNSADTTNGEKRLSWHLSGSGGYRVGDVTSLNDSTDYEKVILFKDS